MNFKDVWATDKEGNKFVFTIEMQRQLAAAGLPISPDSLSELEQTSPPRQAPQSSRREPSRREPAHVERKPEPAPAEVFEDPEAIQIDPNTGKYIGRIKWYNDSKGYGFIARGGSEQIFFHRTDISCDPADLVDGTWVLYDVEETEKGFEANEVELLPEE